MAARSIARARRHFALSLHCSFAPRGCDHAYRAVYRPGLWSGPAAPGSVAAPSFRWERASPHP
eukprot:7336871-Prymnesium_polylepis.1